MCYNTHIHIMIISHDTPHSFNMNETVCCPEDSGVKYKTKHIAKLMKVNVLLCKIQNHLLKTPVLDQIKGRIHVYVMSMSSWLGMRTTVLSHCTTAHYKT